MKTIFDVVDLVFKALENSVVKDAISGGIYKHKRPVGSAKEDVVINCLPINNEQLQETVFNVNIHVPNLVLNIDGNNDTTQPDNEKLKEITATAITALEAIENEDWSIEVQQQQIFEEDDLQEHYSNIRVVFYSTNV